jgi:16S rRNA (cytidine1402-2'-O)-methyltransferase
MPRGENDAPLLDATHAGRGAAETGARATSHLDKDQRPVRFAHDQVNFATTTPRRPIIARNQPQAGSFQVRQCPIFGGVAGLLGGGGFSREFHLSASFASALSAARDAAASQHYPQGALYVVATPIGNLADISLRALHVLQLADAVACEDTRHTQALLRAYGIDKAPPQLLPVHQHNEQEAAQGVIARLQQGQRVAYASDAGTPAVSDPGARLVAAARQAGLRVVPLPGASSITAAVSVAGAQGNDENGFVFAGFLPVRAGERDAAVLGLAREARTVVLLEAPHRIEALGRSLAVLGDRTVTLGRELTKQFEEVVTMPCAALAGWLAAEPQRTRGEFALVLHATAQPEAEDDGLRVLQLLLKELPLKGAVKLAAEITGASKNELYQTALRLKDMDPGSSSG